MTVTPASTRAQAASGRAASDSARRTIIPRHSRLETAACFVLWIAVAVTPFLIVAEVMP